MEETDFPIMDHEIQNIPYETNMAEEAQDEERKELEEEWIKICKKEYQLFENVKNKEEMLKNKKSNLKNFIGERYQLHLQNERIEQPVQVSIDNQSFEYIKQLEKRQDDLKNRLNKLEDEIKNANKDKTFVSHDKTSFLVKEKIHEFLYENEVLEKYVRGEYFRSFDETITALNHSLDVYEKDKDMLNSVKRQLEQEENSILDTIYNLKKEYKSSLSNNESQQDEVEHYNKSGFR